MAALAWGLSRQPAGESAPDRDEASEELDELTGREVTATTRRPTPTTRPDPATTGLITSPDGEAGPLLGEKTGLSLIVGGGNELVVTDLDTGELRFVDRVAGRPIGVFGSMVVLAGNNSGNLWLIDLERSDPEPVQLGQGAQWVDLAWVEDTRVWVRESSFPGPEGRPEWQLVAYDATGTVVDSHPVDDDQWGWTVPGPHSDLFHDPAGGLYRRDGGTYRRVSMGVALAVGDQLILVRECDRARQCLDRWYDVDTFDLVDLPPPPPYPDWSSMEVLGGDRGDRWLAAFDWVEDGGVGRLIEIATGEVVRRFQRLDEFGNGPLVVVSADGRWLLERDDQTWHVVDLDNDTSWVIDVPARSTSRAGLLVELGSSSDRGL